MTLASWFSLQKSHRRRSHTGVHRNRSRTFRRNASFEALEDRFLLSTASFSSGSETINESAGTFSIPVSLSSPATGTPTVSNFTPGFGVADLEGLAFDSAGNLYIADFDGNKVHKVTPQGTVTTFASGLLGPEGLAFGSNGDLYIAENFDGVDEVTPSGQVTDIANGSLFNDPRGIAIDASGNIYVANSGNGTVVKLTPAGAVSPFASGFQNPQGLAINASGDLFVVSANDGNGNNGSVQEVTPDGTVNPYVSGFQGPSGVAIDAAGNLYVPNGFNDPAVVSKVTPAKVVSTFVSAGLHFPESLSFDAAGNLYIANNLENNNIETPEVSEVAAAVTVPFSFTGTALRGVAFSSVTASPLGFLASQTTQNITGTLLSDPGPSQTMVFRLGTPTGGVSLGNPSVETLTINEPALVQFSTGGESVSEDAGTFSIPVTLTGTPGTGPVTVPFTLSGTAAAGVAFSGVTGNSLTFEAGQTTEDITGTLLSDPGSPQTLTFTLGTPSGGAALASPTVNTLVIDEPAAAQFNVGSETVSESAGSFSIPVTIAGIPDGTPTLSPFGSGFDAPFGVAVDSAGNLYVANVEAGTVSMVSPAEKVSTFASGFSFPGGLAFDAAGNLYVIDGGSGTVKQGDARRTWSAPSPPGSLSPSAWPSTPPATSTSPTVLAR